MAAPLPSDEAARMRALRACQGLATPLGDAFERIARLASQVLHMPMTAVSFVDRDRQWFEATVGFQAGETSREASFCAHAILTRDGLVVPDAAADPRFANHPLVTGEPGVRFYAAAPLLTRDGQPPVGTLCVFDRQPRPWDERERHLLSELAALVVDALSLRTATAARQQAEAALRSQEQELKDLHDAMLRRRKLDDRERRRSEHRFRQLFNQAGDAALVHDVDGRLVDVNEVACTSLGYTRAELLTMSVPDFEMTHDPAEGFRFWRELAAGSVEKFEGCHRRKDGRTFPVEIHVSVLETAKGRRLLALIRDITGQKKRQQALLQSEERFRLAILCSPLPVMLFTNDGEILQVNHAWTRLTGYRADELRTLEDWITRCCSSAEEQAEVRGSLADFSHHAGTLERPGRRIRCADGSERIWDFTRANLDRLADGRGLHISTAVDVTERYQAEAALRAAKDEAERANHAKSVFLSRMSHELRTPLNAILGFGQLLELSTLGAQDAMSLGYILKGGRHLLALIDEVLDLSRAETGELHLSREHVNVAVLAQECAGLVARLAQARGITCRVSVPAGTSLWADDQRLRQMLLNLLSNAIKYNRAGGSVLVSSEETAAGCLRLKVSDTGPGIPPEGMARLFVPFERLEQQFSEEEGTGLGLVISQRIAEAMGGTLGVESEAGRGSTFWIELPLAASSPPAPPAVNAAPAPPVSAPAAANATLLYIEDNHSNLQVVKALLANCRPRWRFLSARDGRTGLEQARQCLPGLILLDLQLPGLNGDAVLAELRHDPRTRHIPVVLLSADATAHSRERLLASGADDYISKPFKLDALLGLLDRTLLKAAVSGQM